MINCNPQNERIKRDYVEFLRQADKKSEATVRGVEKSILRFEQHTGFTDFKCFSKAQAISFRAALAKPETKDKPLSPATIHSTLTALQRFLRYLACQPGMKSKIKVTDIEYLNLSDKEVRAATSAPSKPFPTLEQLRHTLATMPAGTEIECRDRALFALLMMTGIRDNAAASLRIRHVDLDRMLIIQDPTTVRTKNSKLIESVLLPLGQDVERAFLDWVAYIRTDLLYGADDPVFPQTASRIDPVRGPLSDGLKPVCWSNSSPIRTIFRRAFVAADLPYFSPHRVRCSIVDLAYRWCKTPEEFKAFNQNLGHSNVATTLPSYGTISLTRQRELIRNAGKAEDKDAKLDRLLEHLERQIQHSRES